MPAPCTRLVLLAALALVACAKKGSTAAEDDRKPGFWSRFVGAFKGGQDDKRD